MCIRDRNEDKKRNSDYNTDNDGVLEDVGRGVDQGVRDVVDGVEEGVEDITGQSDTDRANHAETPERANTSDRKKDTMNREKTGQ